MFLNKQVYVFKENFNNAQMQQTIDEVYERLENGQFSRDRALFIFYPGTYDLEVKVGFYTEVIGLGELPSDVKIRKISSYARWMKNNNATCNFWRAVSNVSTTSDMLWAVSQATSLRRIEVFGDLYLNEEKGWSSGGFLANSLVHGNIYSGTQQQWLTRNTSFNSWIGQNWNMVFVGCSNAPLGEWPKDKYTKVELTEKVKEKPYLIYKDEIYVRVPKTKYNTVNHNFMDEYVDIPLSDFYIVSYNDSAKTINEKLKEKKNILFLPGIYQLEESLILDSGMILGLGYPTLENTSDNHESTIIVNGDETIVSGILIEANDQDNMVKVLGNDVLLCDLYARIGGAYDKITRALKVVIINGNNLIGDHFWLWRADHSFGVGWNVNKSKNGIIVNGNDAIFFALMVEHFEEYQAIFNGENIKVFMYQSESPYDCLDQKDFMSHNGLKNGYSSYKVADHVKKHEGYGIGFYSVLFRTPIDIASGVEAPCVKGVYLKNIITVELGSLKGISNVINDLSIKDSENRIKYYLEFGEKE